MCGPNSNVKQYFLQKQFEYPTEIRIKNNMREKHKKEKTDNFVYKMVKNFE